MPAGGAVPADQQFGVQVGAEDVLDRGCDLVVEDEKLLIGNMVMLIGFSLNGLKSGFRASCRSSSCREFVTVLEVGAVLDGFAGVVHHAHDEALNMDGGEGCRQTLVRLEEVTQVGAGVVVQV